MKSTTLFCLLALLLVSFTVKNNTVKDYFTIPGPVLFNGIQYTLSWSAHPSGNYFKQEYLPAGENAGTFSNMIMMEALVADMTLSDAVTTKISELEQRKKTDPLANYQVIQNPKTGEYMLDFIMSQSAGGKKTVAEWNAYRYTQLNSAGKKGILLFACSKRAYGDAIPHFLIALKAARLKDINTLAVYSIPAIKIKND